MSIISLLLVLVVIGVVLYLFNSVVPIDANIRKIINVVVILFVLVWLVDMFGLLDMHVGSIPRVGRH